MMHTTHQHQVTGLDLYYVILIKFSRIVFSYMDIKFTYCVKLYGYFNIRINCTYMNHS